MCLFCTPDVLKCNHFLAVHFFFTADLAAECRESGWNVRLYPVEVGAGGFVGRSASCLLKDMGLREAKLSRSTKELSEEAEKASHWLWLKQRDKAWGVTSN